MIQTIVKRDGRTVPYDRGRIERAIFKAAAALGGTDESIAASLAVKVEEYLTDNLHKTKPSVAQIQDAVEKVLIEEGHARTCLLYTSRCV